MPLSELVAFDAAYRVLQPLDAASRRRALLWLSDALGDVQPLAAAESDAAYEGPAGPPESAAPASAAPARRRTPAAVADQPAAPKPARKRKNRQPQATPAASHATPAKSGERAYRRMPAVDEVMAAYRQVGTIGGLADHFGVPKYTAQNWARRLRAQGHQIGRHG